MFNRDRTDSSCAQNDFAASKVFQPSAAERLPSSQHAKCDEGECLFAIGHLRSWRDVFRFELVCPEFLISLYLHLP